MLRGWDASQTLPVLAVQRRIEPVIDPNERVTALPNGNIVWDFRKAFSELPEVAALSKQIPTITTH